MVAHAKNSSTEEVETGCPLDLMVHPPRQLDKLQARERSCPQKQKKKKKKVFKLHDTGRTPPKVDLLASIRMLIQPYIHVHVHEYIPKNKENVKSHEKSRGLSRKKWFFFSVFILWKFHTCIQHILLSSFPIPSLIPLPLLLKPFITGSSPLTFTSFYV